MDPGTLKTGWGVVDKTREGLRFCAGDVISVRGVLSQRLLKVHEGLSQVIEEWAPDVVSLEKAFVAHNVQSALRLGEARGIILLAAAAASIPVAEYNPTEIKTAVAGYGRAGKLQVQNAVIAQLSRGVGNSVPSFPKSEDATDALAAAVCHCGSARFSDGFSPNTVLRSVGRGRASRTLRKMFSEGDVARILEKRKTKSDA